MLDRRGQSQLLLPVEEAVGIFVAYLRSVEREGSTIVDFHESRGEENARLE